MIALPSKVFSRKHFILIRDSHSLLKSVRPEYVASHTCAPVVTYILPQVSCLDNIKNYLILYCIYVINPNLIDFTICKHEIINLVIYYLNSYSNIIIPKN